MLRTKGRRRSAAVAEIVGTLVILVATIAIGGVLVAVASGAIQTSSLNQQNQSNLYVQKLQERLTVYDVWFTRSGNQEVMILHVYNFGQVPIQIATIYTNASGSASAAASYKSLVVSSGTQIQITISPFNYVRGTNYVVTIVSSAGSNFVSEWSA